MGQETERSGSTRRLMGFDVSGFVSERRPVWQQLDDALVTAERQSSLQEARRIGKLYRGVSSDLIRARAEGVDASVVDYLNDLVARAYAHVHAGGAGFSRSRDKDESGVIGFFFREFPRRFREEWKLVFLAAAFLLSGAGVGAAAMIVDPSAAAIVLPADHQGHTPSERVAKEERGEGLSDSGQAASFSSFLFTHNIQVTFIAFALGILFGLGTAAILFFNGVPLGALAVQYHLAGHGLFFWAWILPHGIPELTEIFVAGGAGLILGRGMLFPGRLSFWESLSASARKGAALVVGGMPLLIVAGVIEGTISQMHEPRIPYIAKLAFAAVAGIALVMFLSLAGRRKTVTE